MKTKLLTILFLILALNLRAYNEEIYSRLVGGAIKTDTLITVRDQDYPSYSNIKYLSSGVQVRLFFDENVPVFYNDNFRIKIEYELKLYKAGSSPILLSYPLNHTIELDYLKTGILNDFTHSNHTVNVNEVRIAELKVKKITSQILDNNGAPIGGPVTLPNLSSSNYSAIKLELKYLATKVKPINENISISFGHSVQDSSGVTYDMPAYIHHPGETPLHSSSKRAFGNEVKIYWMPFVGAEWYDLEWVFIDGGDDNLVSTNYPINWNNATRIQTTFNYYSIPLLYPRGKIAYRVRGVGIDTSSYNFPNVLKYTNWSSLATNTVQGNCVFAYSGLNTQYNWTATTTYAEDGKQKSVLSIFDPFGKQRQTLTSLSTDSLVVISENVYDHLGRPTVQMLPIVQEYTGLYFTSIKNTSFLKEDFDTEANYAGLGNPTQTSPIMAGNAYSDFYSSNNALLNYSGTHYPKIIRKSMAAYIADAEGYAYQQTRLNNDGSGRPHSQAMPGVNHTLGSGHETKYFYGTPGSQAEIDRLFGNEAGFVAHYKKEMVIDPNGQVSISYKDGYDRVIATALAGDGVSHLLHDLSSASNFPTIHSSAIGNNHINPNNELEATKTILITAPGTPLTIEYTADTAMFKDVCLGDIPCKFEVSISLIDEEGGHLLDFNGINGVIDEPSFVAFTSSGFNYNTTINNIDLGKYTLVKRVRLVDYNLDSSIIYTLKNNIGTDTSNAGLCFEAPIFNSPCKSCEEKCEETYTFTYKYLGVDYKVYRGNDYDFVGFTTDTNLVKALDISGSPIFKLVNIAYTDSLDSLIYECKRICNSTPIYNSNTECDILLAVLKSDLSPGGQYFDNRPQNPAYSVNGAPNYLDSNNTSNTSINYWLYTYADNSNYSTSFVQDFGNLIGLTGTSVNWNVVRERWPDISSKPGFDSLMNVFVQIHPEYCMWLSKCDRRDQECYCSTSEGQGQYLFGTLTEYEDAMYSINDDSTAIALNLFLPLGYELTAPLDIFNSSSVPANKCFGDPLLNTECVGNKDYSHIVYNKLFNFLEDNGTNFSIYEIMVDTSYRWLDISSYSGPRSSGFITYMKTLHGDGNIPGILSKYYDVDPVGTQMSWYSFFKGNYDFARAIVKDSIIRNKYQLCSEVNPNHILTEILPNLNSLPSPLDTRKQHFPYLSALDEDGDGKVDIDLSLYGLEPTIYTSHVGFEVRIPYADIMHLDSLNEIAEDFCEGIVNNLPNLWLEKMENDLVGCKRLISTTLPSYSTEVDTLSSLDRTILLSYFEKIAEEACIAYKDSMLVGVYLEPNFGIGTSSVSTFASYAWGAPTDNNIDAVIQLYKNQYSNIVGCPINLAQISLSDTTAQNGSVNLECNCNQLKNLIGSSGAVYSMYENVYPFVYNEIPGVSQLSDFVDLIALADFVNNEGDGLLNPYSNITVDILEHWINNCANGSIVIDTTLANNGKFPEVFNCKVPSSIPVATCEEEYKQYYRMLKYDAFVEYQQKQWQKFDNTYNVNCLQRLLDKGAETFELEYVLKEHHYTLYYYDRAGNLVKTVPPAGVHPIDHPDTLSKISEFRIEHGWKDNYTSINDVSLGKFRRPNHTKVTYYQYDSKNQVIRQKTPDGGETFTYYDFLGRVAISQNEKQRNYTSEAVSYTLYDDLGRIKEVGEWTININTLDTNKTTREYIESLPDSGYFTYDMLLDSLGSRAQITRTYYDIKVVYTEFGMNDVLFEQKNLRNRISTVAYYEQKPSDWKYYDNAIHYNYDIHGNVKTLVQDIPVLKPFGKQFLFTEYEYDLISGNVNSVHYMNKQAEAYSHYYHYDADNRITRVYTSSNGGLTKELEAKYYYHLLGPLARVELGKKQVQGIDYTYNLQGWIKGVNSDKINPLNDRGTDGNNVVSNIHRNFGIDAYGYSLGYFDNDYKAIGDSTSLFKEFELAALGVDSAEKLMSVTGTIGHGYGLYNGNIVKMVSNTLDCDENPMDVLGRFYQYDQLNRIVQSRAATVANAGIFASPNSESWSSATYGNRFRTHYSYDPDGNILNLKRYDGSGSIMDNIFYGYNGVDNRLLFTRDVITTPGILSDIEGYSNYSYDGIGNLISDSQNDNGQVSWNVYGKVKEVNFANKADLWFGYNPMGNRIIKRVVDSLNNNEKLQVYALDAQGNTLAIYEVKEIDGQHELNCSERLIYGSSRLGMSKKIVNLGSQSGFDMQKMENSIYEFLDPQNAVANAVYVHPGLEKMYLGFKQYELNNHLGNVLSTVSDRKLTKRISDSQVFHIPDVRTATEYYPFGSMLEGWGCSQSFDCNLNTYSFTDTLLSDSYNTGLLSDLIKYPYYDYALITGSSVSYYTEISGNRYLVFNSTTRNQPIMRRIYGVEDYKTYTARFRGRVTSGSAEITIRKYLKSDSTVYSNATSKVVSLNGTWKTDSISFTVDPLYRYTVHVRNSASIGATSINIDFIEVYGEASASYLTCSEDSVGYRFGFNSMPKDNEIYGPEGSGYDFGARIYDSRLGRWMSVDPLAYKAPGWTPYRAFFNNPIRYIDSDGRWEWDANGNLVAQKGDQSYSLAKFLGTSQKNAMTILNRGGVTANDKGILNLKEGQVFAKNDLWVGFKSGSGKVVNNTDEAISHYFNGNGESADVGDQSTIQLLSSDKFQEKHTKITSQEVEPEGYFSVDLTDKTFHIGSTNVDYSVSGNGNSSSVTYTLFSRDGFWDPDFVSENTLGKIPLIRDWTNSTPDGPGPNLERFGGTPYHYKTRQIIFFFKPVEEQK